MGPLHTSTTHMMPKFAVTTADEFLTMCKARRETVNLKRMSATKCLEESTIDLEEADRELNLLSDLIAHHSSKPMKKD